MSRFDLGHICLNVEERGEGPALVLLHGFTGNAADWNDHAASLASSYRVLAVDLLGHGTSDAPNDPRPYRMERCVDDLAALLDIHEIERANWLGYSMGGRVALAFTVAHPKRVERLLLEGASPGIADPLARRERIARDEALAVSIEENGVGAFVDAWMRQPLFASQGRLCPAEQVATREARRANNPIGLVNSLRGAGSGAQEPLWDRLSEISVPVLLITGEEDVKFRDIARSMAACIPNARVALIPEAGHNSHLENPGAFGQTVLEFLRNRETDQHHSNGR